ncbi:MAG: diguanylate cyclase [Candidatus Omnitrophota bacterium]
MLKAKKISLTTKSLRYVLKISFALTFVIPILVILYVFSDYISLLASKKINFTFIVLVSICVAYGGFLLIKQIIEPLIRMSNDAKLIANGDYTRRIKIDREDELGDLGAALNEITSKVKDNMQQLNVFGQEAQRTNIQIQNRILVLSGILQVSNLITQGLSLDEILSSTVEKMQAIPGCEAAVLFSKSEQERLNYKVVCASGKLAKSLFNKQIFLDKGDIGKLFLKIIEEKKVLVLDVSRKKITKDEQALIDELSLRNIILIPIVTKQEVVGMLIIGNNIEDFFFVQESMDFLNIFSKQISIAIENDALIHRVKQLETRDALTGLYNENFIINYLEDEIKRAIMFQRPCSFLDLEIINFRDYRQQFGDITAEKALKKIALIIKDELSPVEKAGRFNSNSFAIVIPEKNKKQAKEKAIKLKRLIDSLLSNDKEIMLPIILNIAVSENPLDGVNANELITKARELLSGSKESKGVILA